MHSDTEIMGEDVAWIMLESECPELLLLLAVRIHHTHRRCASDSTCRCFLESSDEAVD